MMNGVSGFGRWAKNLNTRVYSMNLIIDIDSGISIFSPSRHAFCLEHTSLPCWYD